MKHEDLPLAVGGQAVLEGVMMRSPHAMAVAVRRPDGSVYEWQAEEQLYPFTRPLKDYFDSRRYKDLVRADLKTLSFSVDKAEFERKSRDIPTLCGAG